MKPNGNLKWNNTVATNVQGMINYPGSDLVPAHLWGLKCSIFDLVKQLTDMTGDWGHLMRKRSHGEESHVHNKQSGMWNHNERDTTSLHGPLTQVT